MLELIAEFGWAAVVGVIVWLIRLEGTVKRNKEEIAGLKGIEEQTADQEVRIGKRDEEMRALKHSFEEFKGRLEKLESQQMNMVTQLASIDAKLSLLLATKPANKKSSRNL